MLKQYIGREWNHMDCQGCENSCYISFHFVSYFFMWSQASTSGGVTSDLEGSTSSDPLEGLQPTKPKDFQVFINLVDFTK